MTIKIVEVALKTAMGLAAALLVLVLLLLPSVYTCLTAAISLRNALENDSLYAIILF
jgi:hypothetical protein